MNRSDFIRGLVVSLVLCTAGSLSAAVRSEMIVSTEWLAERLGGEVMVVDVGDRADYEKGHIPGARLLERKSILVEEEGVPNELPSILDLAGVMSGIGLGDRGRIVLYSREPLLATRAWFTLDYLGHGHRVSILDGGYGKWSAEGRATSTASPVFRPEFFTPDVKDSAVTTFKAMQEIVRWRSQLAESLLIIDARPSSQYRGATPGRDVARDRAGHIPAAINIPWERNLAGEGGVFQSPVELQKLYAGVDRGKTVITYCRSGMEASMTYFVLRYLGLDPSLYDGSFIQWSNEATPVV
jgi:thiosulfate/3-mercaptopyruvate sulfurtransferase